MRKMEQAARGIVAANAIARELGKKIQPKVPPENIGVAREVAVPSSVNPPGAPELSSSSSGSLPNVVEALKDIPSSPSAKLKRKLKKVENPWIMKYKLVTQI